MGAEDLQAQFPLPSNADWQALEKGLTSLCDHFYATMSESYVMSCPNEMVKVLVAPQKSCPAPKHPNVHLTTHMITQPSLETLRATLGLPY